MAAAIADGELDDRDVRALQQYLTVLEDMGRARDAEDLYLVVSESGTEYLVDMRLGACECLDYQYRGDQLGPKGCKHLRRVAYATGDRPIPAGIENVDLDLGEHVDGEPRRAATDGGQPVAVEPETSDTDGTDERVPVDGEARFAVHDVVCTLLAPRLDHLLDDFDAWATIVTVAARSTVAACERGR